MQKKLLPTVVVDLDGVLAQYDGKWRGVEQIGEPVPGAVEFTHELAKVANVVIWTTRTNPEVNPVFGPSDLRDIVAVWLRKHGFSFRAIHTGQGKPVAAAYVDDRSVVCKPMQHWPPVSFSEALAQVMDLLPREDQAEASEQEPPSQKRSS